MTLTLTPDTETRLRTFAEEQGLNLTELHDALLTRALEEAEAELQGTLAGLDRSVADFAAGRWITSEELDRRLEAKIAAARAQAGETASAR
jgi:predicted transcriptional regulator